MEFTYTKEQIMHLTYGVMEKEKVIVEGFYGKEICVTTHAGEQIVGKCEGFEQIRPDPNNYASPFFTVTTEESKGKQTKRSLPIGILAAIHLHVPLLWEGDNS
jgi:hypothetical protein